MFATLVYAIWFGWTWPARLEAAATKTINRPIKKHNIFELHSRYVNSDAVLDIAMSAPVTVVVQVSQTDPQLVAIRAATGAACEGPSAFKKHVFVELGLFDHCLIREDTDTPSNALVLRLVRDHGLDSRWIGWKHSAWDNSGQFGHDSAWQFDLSERIDGQETLLGRAVAADLKSDDGQKAIPTSWPPMPEFEQRQAALAQRRAASRAKGAAEENARWAFGARDWHDEFHGTPSTLSYALLERALGVKFDLTWLNPASPDPLRAMDYAERLLFSGDRFVAKDGENLLSALMRPAACYWPASCDPPNDAISTAVHNRGLEIALRVLDGIGTSQGPDISMIHRFVIRSLPKEHAVTLLNKAFEIALLNGYGTDNLFFQLLLNRFKDAQTPLLHARICSFDLKQLRETELKYAERFVLCR
ncbi:hypothetical protein [Sulfitobacter geojensis]|uniref:hypothetical protein n=1 Tax=Sulfitobacter geojensis TaxID=1342299 RepID=UPI0007D9AED6|nr:hypothetical protein [Sulfitobacter geojensis]OAN92682.1 hypothetical protein A8B74_18085 [Sulfitobacter geojensis]